ncbi:MAG: glycosyltransferase, partial [Candidatus Omnitrophota bacterium]
TNRHHIWHMREFFSFSFVNKIIGRLASIASEGIVCMSENIRVTLFPLYRKNNLKVIYEALDNFAYKRYDYSASRKEFDISDKCIVISMISRMHPQKGQYELLEMAQEILKEKDVLFLIAGDIAPSNLRNILYKRKIEYFIRKMNLGYRVRLLGFRGDVDKILSLTDICIFPFLREEPFGLAMAEAFIFGKRVLFYHRRGLDEIDAFFSHAGETLSPENLRQSIEKIRRSRFIENNITIPPVFSFNNYEKEINSFIESVTKKMNPR